MSGSDFVAHVLDLLRPLGGVAARRMFGGHGLFRRGLMFALIDDDVLYLKVDDRTRPDFVAVGAAPFTYASRGRTVTMSYYEAPPGLFDDPDEMRAWAQKALAAASRDSIRRGSPPMRPR
ncbi:MAG TPA: TfoX/Sxy family protein [Alphaproteobacteria bacterium]